MGARQPVGPASGPWASSLSSINWWSPQLCLKPPAQVLRQRWPPNWNQKSEDNPALCPKSRSHPGLGLPPWEGGWSLSQGRNLETGKQQDFEVIFPFHISPDTRRAAPICSPGTWAGFIYGESIPASTEGTQFTLYLLMDRFF